MTGFFGPNLLSIDWSQLSARLSITLLHFMWQGLAAGIGVAIALYLMRTTSANSRYRVACIAMFCLPLTAIITFSTVTVPSELYDNINQSTIAASRTETPVPREIASLDRSETNSIDESGSYKAGRQNDQASEVIAVLPKKQTGIPADPGPEQSSELSLRSLYPFAPWLSGLYVLGVALMSLRLMIAMYRGSRLRSRCTPVTDIALIAVVEKLATQMGLKVAPVVCYCEQVTVPAVVGVLKRAILLPVSLTTNLAADELAAILSHEMAHIRRLDPVFQLLQRTIETLLFFHPVVWWISRQVGTERENCCDDLAAATGHGNVGYASALLRTAELCMASHNPKTNQQVAALSAAGTNINQFSRRIERQLKMNATPMAPARLLLTGLSILLFVGFAAAVISGSVNSTTADNALVDAASNNVIANDMNSMTQPNEQNDSLKRAIDIFNEENDELERGLDQAPLTEDEVLTAIRNCKWEIDSGRLNEAEFALLKKVGESGELPDDAYFSVYTQQQTGTFIVQHFWRVQLLIPAIGHDGFVPFTIRDSKFADEIIDPASIAWGDEDVDGLSLGAYLSPKKNTYQFGERVRLRLFVRNNGTKPVETSWSRLSEPMSGEFTVVDDSGHEIVIHLGHHKWAEQMVSGGIAGTLQPDATHHFNVPFEIRIGGTDTINTNQLIGRLIDAKPGQKLQMKIRSTTGNNRTRHASNPWVETGSIGFAVTDDTAIRWGKTNNGMRLGIRPAPIDDQSHGPGLDDWIRYEVWVRNETDSLIEIPRDPRIVFAPRFENGSINIIGTHVRNNYAWDTEPYTLKLKAGDSALLILQQSIQTPIANPGITPGIAWPNDEFRAGDFPMNAKCDIIFQSISASGVTSENQIANLESGQVQVFVGKTTVAPASEKSQAQPKDDKENIPLDDAVWQDAGNGLEAGFLLTSKEGPNQRVPMNSAAEYKILVRNKSDDDITFLARLVPHEMADAPYLIPDDNIDAALREEKLPEEFRSAAGPSHVLEPAYVITLAPGESAIIRNQRAVNGLGLFVGNEGESTYPKVAFIEPGMNWIVQPLQLHVPPPSGGTELLGQAYTLTKVDRQGKMRQEPAVRRTAEPGGHTVYPRIQLDVGALDGVKGKNDLEASMFQLLRGRWILDSQSVHGEANENAFQIYALEFKDRSVIVEQAPAGEYRVTRTNPARVTINANAEPMEMNWVGEEGALVMSVFECKENILTIAHFGRPKVARPKQIAFDEDSKAESPLLVWKLKKLTGEDFWDLEKPWLNIPLAFPEDAKSRIQSALNFDGVSFVRGNNIARSTMLIYHGETIGLNQLIGKLAKIPELKVHVSFKNAPATHYLHGHDFSIHQMAADAKINITINVASENINLDDLYLPNVVNSESDN